MSDNFSQKTRKKIMSSVKNKDTEIEIIVRKFLFSKGFRYRKNDKRYPGSPDIVLPKYKTVIFVNGCFWHGHQDCLKAKLPETNKDFWIKKINKNISRDKETYAQLNCNSHDLS